MNDDMIVLKIEDRKYGMRKMPPVQGAAFGLKVASLVAKIATNPSAQKCLEELKNTVAEEKNNLDQTEAMSFGTTIISLISCIDAEELEKVFRTAMGYGVVCDNYNLSDPIAFDEYFSKHPGDLYPVEFWATYNHVKDFFVGAGAGVKALFPSLKTSQTPAQ